jgi:PAS domain S-box-containing protein
VIIKVKGEEMNTDGMKPSDLEKDLKKLREEYNSMKELYERKIDELRLPETNHLKSEEIFRIAYTTSPDAINITRLLDGMYISVNEGFTKLLGYSSDESVGRTSLEMNIWLDPQDRLKMVNELNTKGSVKNFETRFLAKNGRIVDGLMSASMMELDGVPHILTVTRDITIRKKAEEALAKERFLINALMDSLTDHVYFKDLSSKFVRNNKAHAQSFGLQDPMELTGKTDFDFFTREAALQAFEDEQRIIRTGEIIQKEEKLTRKNHSDAWFSVIKMPLYDSEKRIIGTFGISRDITDRKRTEFENQILFEISQGVTTTSNLDELMSLIHSSLGKVVYAENIFVALFDQATGLFSFPYFIDKIDETPLPTSMSKSCSAYVYNTVRPLVLTQKIFDDLVAKGEVELVGSNSPSWIGIPLQTPSKVIGVLVLQHYEKENVYSENDVNFLVSIGSHIAMAIERKKAEDEISVKNEQLRNINAEKDKFFSIIAHDLRSPLSSFVGATQILTEEINTMTIEEITEITQSMKLSASNIYNLLENLLEWSRLKRDGIDFVQEQLNLNSYVNECASVFSEPARKKNIALSVAVNEGIEVIADKHMLETVIRNLISNAIKFSNPGGSINVSAHETDGHFIEVKVSDSGIGMPPELKNKLFMINEKTSRRGTGGELSSGLGLLLCKEFIEKGGGRIWVESFEGRGTDFIFTLIQFKPNLAS